MKILIDKYGDLCDRHPGMDYRAFGIPMSAWLTKGSDHLPLESSVAFLTKKSALVVRAFAVVEEACGNDPTALALIDDLKTSLKGGQNLEPHVLEHYRIDLKATEPCCPVDYYFIFEVGDRMLVTHQRDFMPLLFDRINEVPEAIRDLDRFDFLKERANAKLDRETESTEVLMAKVRKLQKERFPDA